MARLSRQVGLVVFLLGFQGTARLAGVFHADAGRLLQHVFRLAVSAERPQHRDLLFKNDSEAVVVAAIFRNSMVGCLLQRLQSGLMVAFGLQQRGSGNLTGVQGAWHRPSPMER